MDISPKKDGGILKSLLFEIANGKEKIRPLFGDRCYVKYCGMLLDGTIFDSNETDNHSFVFTLGKAEVPLVWEFGVPTMIAGEVAEFVSKPEYAYGIEGKNTNSEIHKQKIPPNSVVKFRIELLDFHGEDISDIGDGSIMKSCMQAGETYGMPNDGAKCTVDITGIFDGRIFEQRVATFDYGEGLVHDVVEGVEVALRTFSRNEKARLKILPHLAFGDAGCHRLNIPPNASLIYHVHLLDCVRAKDFWDMSSEEKLENAISEKWKANNYYKSGNWKLSAKLYQRCVEFVQFEELYEGLEAQRRRGVLITCLVNLALCQLHLDQPFDASQSCTRALELDASNEKALFKRADAYLVMNDYKSAVEDLQRVVSLNSRNMEAKKHLRDAVEKLKEQKKVERNRFAGMFEKFAKNNKEPECPKSFNAKTYLDELVKQLSTDLDGIDIDKDLEEILGPESNA